jgi:hypothetical protein
VVKADSLGNVLNTLNIDQTSAKTDALNIYPNPASTKLFIVYPQASNSSLSIYNLMGEKLISQKINGSIEIDVSTLASGVYIARAENMVKIFIKE